jgi:hypothetical protein
MQKFFLCQIKNFMGDAPGEIPHTPKEKAKKSKHPALSNTATA